MEQSGILTPRELFGAYTHVGVVVRDLDRHLATLKTLFGYTTKEFGITPDTPDRRYRGEFEDFAVKMAFIDTGRLELELLMPIRGRSVWQDFLDARGDGIHHLNYYVKDFDAAISHLEAHRCMMVQNGLRSREPGCRWAYVDATDRIGYYIEVGETRLG